MNRINKNLLSALCFGAVVLFSDHALAQSQKDYSEHPYWIEMMQDHSVNFFDVQNAFEAYWEGREITKGSGWKPFKRWEWRMERHIYPDGSRHEPDKVYKEYMNYMMKNPGAKNSNGNWTNLGPFNIPSKGYEGLGRINAIAFHPTDPNVLYIGAPAGGCWKYDGLTQTWSSTTDVLPTLGVSAIVVDWNNPGRVFIGTGDRDAGDAFGMGVFKSEDAGLTWQIWNNGMGNRTVGMMIQHPVNPAIIYAATSGGVYKTTDGGANWVFKHIGGTKDIVFKPNNPSVIYAGGPGKFFKSADDGETWVQITNGIPNASRSVIAVTPANPNVVYCLLTTGDSFYGLYRSGDSGETFTLMSNSPNIMSWGCTGGSGGQAWYDLDMAADPLNENVIYAGGVNCFKSTNGGATWQISSHWWGDCSVPAVHADLHILEYNPINNRLYAGNDGGIYYTDDGGLTWPEITDGLPISQVYKIGQSKTDKNKVINGYQDNGTSTWYGGGNWQTSFGGDGMECAFDHQNPAWSYATIYYGSIYRLFNNTGAHKIGGNGAYGMNEEGGWITPFCLHEGDPGIMFAGMKNIWRAIGIKTNNFTWKKITEGGSGNIHVVEHSPANHNLFFYSRAGQLYRSDDIMADQPQWTTLTSYVPGSGNIYDIECHPYNENVVFVTRGSKVYRSDNKGFSWTNITGSLPDINMLTLAFYLNSVDGIYVGSDAGVYYRDASMTDWIMFSNGLPVDASVNEVEIFHNPGNPAEDEIRAGTYGRGLWTSPMWQGQPAASFTSSETTVPVGCAVDFLDLSLGVPTSWLWTFEGASPASSTDKNPSGVVYLNQGTFSVTLTVSNSVGSDTQTLSGYMTVSESAVPDVSFIASDSITCSGVPVQFTDNSNNCPTGWHWSFNPGTVAFLNGTTQFSQHPVISFFSSGTYSVTLTVNNSAGSNSLEKSNYMHIGGISIPFFDDFESGLLSTKSWRVENPDFGITWDIATTGGNGSGDKSAFMNFYDYLVPPGPRDQLITPLLNFAGNTNVVLTFEHAYAKRHSSVTDSLIVKISNNCGQTWTRIWAAGENNSGSFATRQLMTTPFVPEVSEDWCGSGWGADCFLLELDPYIGNGQNIQIMFESYNHFGNNLYIDNVMISPLTLVSAMPADGNVLIYPNPSTGMINMRLPEEMGQTEVLLYNAHGGLVKNFIVSHETRSYQFNLDDHGAGIYFIHLIYNQGKIVRKVVVK
jgi:PKD repeat protein/photosystem II stability/assembly factor-like uncharacterized protein